MDHDARPAVAAAACGTILRVLILLATFAFAAPPDPATDDSVRRALAGDCPGAEPGLLRRVEATADDVPARLALDACRYAGTERGGARVDLEDLFRVGAPFDPSLLTRRRGTDPAAAARLQKEAELAALLVVQAMVAIQAYEEAQAALPELAQSVGDCGPLAAAAVLVDRGYNGPAAAWKAAERGVAAFLEDPEVLEVAGRLVFEDATQAPPALVDAVLIRGRPSARLNVLLGLLRANKAQECVARAATTPAADADRPALDAVRYRCAAAAGDLATADTLRVSLRPPVDEAATILHAQLLDRSGRETDALGLVVGLVAKADAAAELAITIHARNGRAAEAEAVAAGTAPGSFARLSAGTQLLKLREYARVRLLLEGTCEKYGGAHAALCARALEAARAGR